ncbi:ArsR/SmtB family transcription factor [Amycolatopsis alba]|uniref:Transcriptional regulator n=1 Tax=Amycolatopsis alba DSM 44262 TaxID=1125972 RepID=A0A229RFI8_AMYAL|nr:helix-turn-helix transcriptional regulator [Amycolatopsis alba]OXM45221.1 transcriptional regulator [Amycolatopsis alba DSM 44262]
MDGEPDIARAAALIADGSRARILKALSGGRALSATVLAAEAGVRGPTASAHLTRLLDAGMVVVERDGRNRNYRLASTEITTALEALAVIAPPLPISTLRQSTRTNALRRSRTCYDHVAGKLGVELMAALVDGELISGRRKVGAKQDRPASYGRDMDYELTDAGKDTLRSFGVDPETLPVRRAPIRYCVDWSERRHHLAGSVAAAVTERMFTLGWIRHGTAPRMVHVTEAGADGLRRTFGVDPAPWRDQAS